MELAGRHSSLLGIFLNLEVALGHAGVYVAGTYAVASDAEPAKVDGDGSREVDDAALGSAVGAEVRLDPESVHRPHVHDRPAAEPAPPRAGRPSTQIDPLPVDR